MKAILKPAAAEPAMRAETGREAATAFVEGLSAGRMKEFKDYLPDEGGHAFENAIRALAKLPDGTLEKLKPVFGNVMEKLPNDEAALFLYWSNDMVEKFGDDVKLYRKAAEKVLKRWKARELGDDMATIGYNLGVIFTEAAPAKKKPDLPPPKE